MQERGYPSAGALSTHEGRGTRTKEDQEENSQ
uniref:Uncharacterized protein n=1 Tax=Parascaris equorum TaxID=6256 RepID=A0A914RMN4_PAREQ